MQKEIMPQSTILVLLGTQSFAFVTISCCTSRPQVKVPIRLSPDLWVLSMEQVLLFILIIGRWLMPKGDVSHDQLSQLLFVYIGIASDIMELLILFNESYVIQDEFLTLIILGSWSFSLMQFTLVLTVTKGRKTRAVGVTPKPETAKNEDRSCKCCETEIWSILTAMFMQDAPFLAIRLYVMIKNQTLTYNILFFTFKNALILGMQLYRLFVVISNHYVRRRNKGKSSKKNKDEDSGDASADDVDIEIGSNADSVSGGGNRESDTESERKNSPLQQQPNGTTPGEL